MTKKEGVRLQISPPCGGRRFSRLLLALIPSSVLASWDTAVTSFSCPAHEAAAGDRKSLCQ